jgi:hypothetical protein
LRQHLDEFMRQIALLDGEEVTKAMKIKVCTQYRAAAWMALIGRVSESIVSKGQEHTGHVRYAAAGTDSST